MGIRFACHQCGKRLNIKSELAGRRGVCPACATKFRIPLTDVETSTPLHDAEAPKSQPALVGSPLYEHEPDATWYVRPPSGGQYGPADTGLLKRWIAEGRVAATSYLWRDGWHQWRTAAEALPELAGQLPGGVTSGGTIQMGTPGAGVSSGLPTSTLNQTPASVAPGTIPAPSVVTVGTSDEADPAVGLELSGQATLGAQRRERSLRRLLWLGLLSAVALGLVVVLLVVASRES